MVEMRKASLSEIGSLFLRIGNTTFGGGDPTMAALQREMVVRRAWITAEEYGLCFSLARVTPGTNVLAFCAASAWLAGRWAGSALAVMAACVPSAMLSVVLVHSYEALEANAAVQGVVGGMVASVAGMMLAGALLLFRGQIGGGGSVARALAVTGGAAVLVGVFDWSPVPVLALAAAAGALWKERE
jgi:chromate transporter